MPPITLTPQQFARTAAARKQGASYKTYTKYIANARSQRPASAKITGPMAVFAAGLNPAQQTAAQTSVKTQIDAAIAANNAASQAAVAQQQTQANRAQGFALALGSLRKNAGQEALADYSSAAGQIQGFGTGLTGALQEAQQAQADQAKAQVDKLTGGLGQVQGYDLPALHDALQYGHVTLPATTLAGRAADAAIQARMATDTSAANVGNIAQQYLAKATDLKTQIAAKNAELQATRPQLLQTALTGLSDAQRQQRALDVQVGTLQLQTAKTVQDQAVAMTNLTGTLHVVNSQGRVIDTGRQAAGSAAARTTSQNVRAAADRRVRQEIANAQAAAKVDAAKTAAAAKVSAAQVTKQNAASKPATPKQRSDILKNSSAQGGALVKTTVDRIAGLVPGSDPIRAGEKPEDYAKRHEAAMAVYRRRLQEHRGQIVNRVGALITPQLQLLKYGPGQIAATADAIVSAYIPKPGG